MGTSFEITTYIIRNTCVRPGNIEAERLIPGSQKFTTRYARVDAFTQFEGILWTIQVSI
jgi:hypothetical protein